MTQSRIDALRQAAWKYGAVTTENDAFVKRLAHVLREGFAEYLGVDLSCVSLVPAAGDYDPRLDYRDAAFSTYLSGLQLLEPIQFGLSVMVQNLGDSGANWLAISIEVMKRADRAEVFVGQSPKISIPAAYEGCLEPVFERLYNGMADFYAGAEDLQIGFTYRPHQSLEQS
jgi:hypothetical protein